MILQEQDLLKISREPVDEWIEVAREDHRVLKVHYYGEGTAEHLKKIDGLEGAAEYEVRKLYAVSNQWLLEGLLRPLDNVFSAKGKTVEIDIPSDELRQVFANQLKNVKSNLSLEDYLRTIWKDKMIADPCGLIFLEVKRNEFNGYLTQKSITHIRKMKLDGLRPEYVMFEADVTIDDIQEVNGEKKNKGYTLHWFVDDAFYYRLKVWAESEKPSEILEQLPNTFGYVPGIVNSNMVDTNRKIHVSPIHKQVELLDKYLRNASVHELFLAKHGYPVFWAYGNVTDACNTCSGTGNLIDDDNQVRGVCKSCKGKGYTYRKDVSDVILLNPPKTKDAPIIAPNVAGYNGPDRGVSEDQRVEEDWTKDHIYFSLWGTTTEKQENETATGRFIDIQPVNNRLNEFGDMVDRVATEIITMFGDLYTPVSFQGAAYSVGRRFMIETPDQIWEKYSKAKSNGASETILNQLLRQYYETEYQTNDMLRDYYVKVSMLDPLPHHTISAALSLPIPDTLKQQKLYLNDYLNAKTMVEIIEVDLDKLKSDFVQFINENYGGEHTPSNPEGQGADGEGS